MVRKDLQLFFSDRRAVIMSFVVPIAIASFFGSIFSGAERRRAGADSGRRSSTRTAARSRKAIVAGAQARHEPRRDDAVGRRGARATCGAATSRVAVVIPPGFGDAAGRAFFGGGEKPAARSALRPVARGRAGDGARHPDRARHAGGQHGDVRRRSRAGSWSTRRCRELDVSGDAGRPAAAAARAADVGAAASTRSAGRRAGGAGAPGLTHAVHGARGGGDRRHRTSPTTATRTPSPAWAFSSCCSPRSNSAIGILLERQRGLWKRLRSAPISRLTLLAGQGGERHARSR